MIIRPATGAVGEGTTNPSPAQTGVSDDNTQRSDSSDSDGAGEDSESSLSVSEIKDNTETSTTSPLDIPSPTSGPETLETLRSSAMWVSLGPAARAGAEVQNSMVWRNLEGVVGEMSNANSIWDQTMVPMRDELLSRRLNEQILPAPIFAGKSYQVDQSVRVVTWWTNGPTGTSGRGQMMVVFAGWLDTDNVHHTDAWAVLLGVGAQGAQLDEGNVGAQSARLLSVSPKYSVVSAELPDDQGAAFANISAFFNPWLIEQKLYGDPLEMPCPTQGCS